MTSSTACDFDAEQTLDWGINQQLADAVFDAALRRDEGIEAGRTQEAARWQAILLAIDELVSTQPSRILH